MKKKDAEEMGRRWGGDMEEIGRILGGDREEMGRRLVRWGGDMGRKWGGGERRRDGEIVLLEEVGKLGGGVGLNIICIKLQ